MSRVSTFNKHIADSKLIDSLICCGLTDFRWFHCIVLDIYYLVVYMVLCATIERYPFWLSRYYEGYAVIINSIIPFLTLPNEARNSN